LLQFTPQRLMVFLGPPLALLGAARLSYVRKPALQFAFILCGVCSIATGALFFQGPLLQRPGLGPFARLHPEFVLPDDAEAISRLQEGTVLAPYRIADAISVMRPGMRVIGGVGATDLSDQFSVELQPQVDAFFSAGMAAEARLPFLLKWCVDTIYFPATWPVDDVARAEIESLPNVTTIRVGEATVLTVNPETPF
jgi:hypothetical protein